MDKQRILDAMETDIGKSLDAFGAAAQDLLHATYIIASGKISKLLQTVAQSRPLYEFMARETEGYGFVEDFRARQFRDEKGRPYIAVPTERRDRIRFAFCLLYALDTGKLNIEKLLHTFYYDSDANSELRAFCAEVVAPFADDVIAEFTSPSAPSTSEPDPDIDLSGVHNLAPTDAEQLAAPQPKLAPSPLDDMSVPAVAEDAAVTEPLRDEETSPQPSGALAETERLLAEIVHVVSHDITISILEREELLLLSDAFATSLHIGDRKSVRIMYIGLKNTIAQSSLYEELRDRADKLAETMREVGIYA